MFLYLHVFFVNKISENFKKISVLPISSTLLTVKPCEALNILYICI